FVDVLGQGMELSSLPKLNNVNGTAGVPSLTNHGTYVTESVKYTFLDYDSYVVVATDKDLVDTVIKVTLTWEIDAADLLNHIFRFNDQSDPSAGYKEADPIRLTYKVGMIPEVAAAGVSGNYFANKFASSEANAYAEFAPALDNPSYFKVNDFSKVGVVDTLDNLGYDGGAGYGIGNFYKGTLVPPSPSGTLYNVYVTRAMAEFSQLTPGKEISERQIGTLVSELDVDDYAGNAGFLAALEDSIMNCAAATAADGSDTYGFKTGVPTSTYAGGLQAIILKVDGLDVVGMPDYVSKSSLAVNGVMTTRLGNNGVLELVKTTVAQTIGLSGYSSAYTFGDPAFDVCIQGQSGTGAVTYSLVDNTDGAASISATATGATITLLKAGTFKIKVSIEADNDYDAAEFTTELITVSEEDMLPPTGDGNGITLLLWLAGLSFVILLCMAFRAKRGNPYNNMSSQT
ncbi:MAG: hypothetical protein FWD43_04000, partial [Coriobacteriia bacterium]|nr:hypothetical protein [Coriobacteriia bacterium]